MPANIEDPAWLADTTARVLGDLPGLTVTVRDEKWLAANGFGGVLAVGGGSARPPRLVELAWRPAKPVKGPDGGAVKLSGVVSGNADGGAVKLGGVVSGDTAHLALVGKGITFDTGGISLKRANDSLKTMGTDMAGAGAVIAALGAIARLKLPVRVTGLVPLAENHFSGSAYRPGDILRHYDGTTTEVTNTDAEGRLVLADAMGYARRVHKPDALVDVATLTGAMKTSLGLRTGGLFASSDELATLISEAGAGVGEAWWRMPLCGDAETVAAEFAGTVASEVADVRQMPGGPGGIAAALFLREFTGGLPWAHLDVAGPARAASTYAEVVPGATGYPARTLVALAERVAGDFHGSLR
jgi:leucyl aminopeptidase